MMHGHRMPRPRAILAAALVAAPLLVAATSTAAHALLIQAPAPVAPLASSTVPAVEPNDSLYRAAREALNRNEYERAAELFERLIGTAPDSPNAPDAYYWRAFALYRIGGADEMRTALAALELQRVRHPNARTRGDAEALATRIRGALARRGDAEAAASLARTVEATRPSIDSARAAIQSGIALEHDAATAAGVCEKTDGDLRAAALNALLHMDAGQALPIVTDVLARRDECSAPLRRRAVFILAQHVTEETERALLDVTRNDPDLETRRQAVFWLSQVGTETALIALEEVIRTAVDAALQEHAIFALAQHPDPRASQVLREYALREDTPRRAREQAIVWISQNPTPENAAFLRDVYGRVADEGLKERTVFAVSQIQGEENRAWLLGIAGDAAEPTRARKQAVFWAAEMGTPTEALASLYDSVDEREIREHLLFVFAQRGDRAAVDRLLDIARNDPDPRLRERALFWLARSEDPRVADFIREILGGTTTP